MDKHGALRIHPEDAAALGFAHGDPANCRSARGELRIVVEIDDTVRRGMVTLPHGYGSRYQGSEPMGPVVNRLTAREHCDPFSKTPYHKYVPVQVSRMPLPVACPQNPI